MPPQEERWSYNRRFAQPFLQGLAREDISGAEGLRRLRAMGTGYQEGLFYQDWRRERGLVLHQEECEGLRPTTEIPERVFTKTDWPGMTNKYHYVFRYSGYNTETGESFVDTIMSFGFDREILPGEAESQFFEILSKMAELSPIVVEEQHMMAVRRRTWGMD